VGAPLTPVAGAGIPPPKAPAGFAAPVAPAEGVFALVGPVPDGELVAGALPLAAVGRAPGTTGVVVAPEGAVVAVADAGAPWPPVGALAAFAAGATLWLVGAAVGDVAAPAGREALGGGP
jgi:hypothetical protein